MSDKNGFTYDDIDIIETALEFFVESFESGPESAEFSEAEKREMRHNIRQAKSALRKIQRMYD